MITKRRPHIKSMLGWKHGLLTVLELTETPKTKRHTGAWWKCRCSCGKEVVLSGGALRRGQQSCGCAGGRIAGEKLRKQRLGVLRGPGIRLLKGTRFGRLTIISETPKHDTFRNGYFWKCRCKCGTILWVYINALRSGNTRSCGCLQRDHATNMRGAKHPNYNPNLSDLDRKRRKHARASSDSKWDRCSRDIKKRDNYTCLKCGIRGSTTLATHHIFDWYTYPELRYRTENCVTLCTACHVKFHQEYGYSDNDASQMQSFIASRSR